MRRFLLWMLWCVSALGGAGQSNTPLKNMPFLDGDVYTMATDGTNVYLGGTFTMVGESVRNVRPYAAKFNLSGMTLSNVTMPVINSGVNAVAPDGNGGWYIAGNFTSVNGVTRNRAARINSDGSLHAWNPNVSTASSYVYAIAVSGGKVFLGGSFNTVGSQTRNQLAAVDAETGAIDMSWNPGANGTVNSLLVSGGKLYVGGGFSTISSVTRNGLAAVDAASGTLDAAWNPNPSVNTTIKTMFISGSKLYIGGTFVTMGGTTRRRAAAVDASTGALDAWDPNIEAAQTSVSTAFQVYAMALYNGKVYIGGTFTKVGAAGTSKNRLAAVDATSGALDNTWDPNPSNYVNTMQVIGTKLYVGGDFDAISTTNLRSKFAGFDLTNGSLLSGTPDFGASSSASVYALAATETELFVGGTFSGAGGTIRKYAAAVKASDGSLQSWNPMPNNFVNKLYINGTSLYAGGAFNLMNGVSGYNRLAKWDLTTGNLVTTWKPNVTSNVNSMVSYGGKLYVGGTFTAIGMTTRNRLAAFDEVSGALDSWDPNANGEVKTIIENNGILYVGGSFTAMGATPVTYNRLAAFNASTGAIIPDWNPNVEGTGSFVKTLLPLGTDILVGGFFTTIGGVSRTHLGAVSATGTGALNSSWNPAVGSQVEALVYTDSKVYVGGNFSSIMSASRTKLAAIDQTLSTVYSWAPKPDYMVYTILPVNGNIWTAGQFTKVNGFDHGKIAVYTPSLSWNGSVNADWGTAANWTPAAVPLSVSDLTVPAGLTNYPALTANTTLGNLTIESGASFDVSDKTLTITSNLSNAGTFSANAGKLVMGGAMAQTITGNVTVKDLEINNPSTGSPSGVTITAGIAYKLNVTGTLQMTAGTLITSSNLVLKSSASGSARIAAHTTASTISGNAAVERFIDVQGKDKQWRTLGFPHSADITISSITGFAQDFNTGSRSLMYYNEGSDNGAYSGSGGTQRNGGYVSFTSTTGAGGTIPVGKGIMAWLYGNSGGIAGTGKMTGSLTIKSTGALNETGADVSLPVSYTAANTYKGWNLVANPFASAIDWNSADIVKTHIDNTIYRWNPASASWTTYNGSIGNPASVDGVIEAGSAFFVKANDVSPVLTVKQNAKTASSTGFSHFSKAPFRLSGISSERAPSTAAKLAGVRISVKGQGNPLPDEAYLDISRTDATSNFDPKYDAESMGRSSGAGIGIRGKEELHHALLFDAPLKENGTETRYYPLKVTSPAKGATTLELWTEGTWNAQNSVALIDQQEGKTILLKDGRLSYPFNMDALKSEGRFVLAINHVKADAAGLPAGFDVKLLGNPVISDRLDLMVIYPSARPKHWSVVTINGQQIGAGNFSADEGSVQHRLTVPAMRSTSHYILRVEMDNGEEKVVKFIRQ